VTADSVTGPLAVLIVWSVAIGQLLRYRNVDECTAVAIRLHCRPSAPLPTALSPMHPGDGTGDNGRPNGSMNGAQDPGGARDGAVEHLDGTGELASSKPRVLNDDDGVRGWPVVRLGDGQDRVRRVRREAVVPLARSSTNRSVDMWPT
jgi:hypothetical protein